MKKFIKWFLLSVFILGGVALAVCYMVIPERTKAAADVVIGYMNTPLFIAGGTTVTVGLVITIVIKFIYDRYKDNVKKELESVKSDFEAKKKELTEKEEELKNEFETCIKELENRYNELQDKYLYLIDVHNKTLNHEIDLFKLIPNKKVQEKVEELYGREERIDNQAEEE